MKNHSCGLHISHTGVYKSRFLAISFIYKIMVLQGKPHSFDFIIFFLAFVQNNTQKIPTDLIMKHSLSLKS